MGGHAPDPAVEAKVQKHIEEELGDRNPVKGAHSVSQSFSDESASIDMSALDAVTNFADPEPEFMPILRNLAKPRTDGMSHRRARRYARCMRNGGNLKALR